MTILFFVIRVEWVETLKRFLFFTLCLGFLLGFSRSVLAAEPSYCSVDYFKQNEIVNPLPGAKLKKVHAFKFGDLTLVGLGVGESESDDVRTLARTYSKKAGKNQKYCTWYLNTLNIPAMFKFRWLHLPMPSGVLTDSLRQSYISKFEPEIFERDLNILDCAQDYNYIALGCNSMKHRGPTAFAMVLSFSGCEPDNATKIANYFWGENGILFETRSGLAEAAYEYGIQNPDQAKRLENIFLGKK